MSWVEPYRSVVDVWLLAMTEFPGFGILNIEISKPVLFNKLGFRVFPPVWIDELKKLSKYEGKDNQRFVKDLDSVYKKLIELNFKYEDENKRR